jgi:hypothetical protein
VYRSSGLEGGVEEERSISQNKKKTAIYLHLKSRVCHVFIGKGWTGGFKISSRMTFDQPSVGRAFS